MKGQLPGTSGVQNLNPDIFFNHTFPFAYEYESHSKQTGNNFGMIEL